MWRFAIVFLVLAFLQVLLITYSLNSLATAVWPAAGPRDQARLARLGRGLRFAPLLVIALLLIVVFALIGNDELNRLGHGLFALGLWMTATVATVNGLFLLRARAGAGGALGVMAVSLALAGYFTPITHYTRLVPPAAWPATGGLGLLLIALCVLQLGALQSLEPA